MNTKKLSLFKVLLTYQSLKLAQGLTEIKRTENHI